MPLTIHIFVAPVQVQDFVKVAAVALQPALGLTYLTDTKSSRPSSYTMSAACTKVLKYWKRPWVDCPCSAALRRASFSEGSSLSTALQAEAQVSAESAVNVLQWVRHQLGLCCALQEVQFLVSQAPQPKFLSGVCTAPQKVQIEVLVIDSACSMGSEGTVPKRLSQMPIRDQHQAKAAPSRALLSLGLPNAAPRKGGHWSCRCNSRHKPRDQCETLQRHECRCRRRCLSWRPAKVWYEIHEMSGIHHACQVASHPK